MTYKAIGFDWGGVISGKPGKAFGQAMATLIGVTEDAYLEAYFHHNTAFNKDEIGFEELWSRVLEELGEPEKINEVRAFVEDSQKDSINEGVVALIDKLRQNGYKVGLLSNNTKEKGDTLRVAGYNRHFDAFHISAETGFVKPTSESFLHFASALGVESDELIFIDDTPKSLSLSKEVGFTPILFESCDQLIADLRQLGINI